MTAQHDRPAMTKDSLQAVLFDFDGTLAPNLDLPDMRRRVLCLTRDAGVPDHVVHDRYIVEVITAAHGWLSDQRMATAAAYYEQAHQLIFDIELQAAMNTQPFPEIPDYLRTLRRANLATAVVTRNCRTAVLKTFPRLLDFVDALFARDDVVQLKPNPTHLRQAIAHLNAEPARTAMVGDGKLDMSVGRALGMYCVGVLTGSSDRAILTEAGADIVIARCADFDPSIR